MGTKPQSGKKPITVVQVGGAAFILAVIGGIYGFFSGGLAPMAIIFIEVFIVGFVLFYTGASFIELARK